MRISLPFGAAVAVIACPPMTATAEDDVELDRFSRFLQSVPEVRAGRACFTRYACDYAGIEWKETYA